MHLSLLHVYYIGVGTRCSTVCQHVQLSFTNFNILFFVHTLYSMAEAVRLLYDFFVDHDCKALRLYLKKNYDCTARQPTPPQHTLLHHVASLTCTDCDKASMVQTLVKRGVEVDVKDDNSMTPLMHCAGVPAAKALLKAGADVHAVCNEQKTDCSALGHRQQQLCLSGIALAIRSLSYSCLQRRLSPVALRNQGQRR
jgi:hypothetical protein